jgi:hypothetical protein
MKRTNHLQQKISYDTVPLRSEKGKKKIIHCNQTITKNCPLSSDRCENDLISHTRTMENLSKGSSHQIRFVHLFVEKALILTRLETFLKLL